MNKLLSIFFLMIIVIPSIAGYSERSFERYELETHERLESLSDPEQWPNCAYKNYRLGKELTTKTSFGKAQDKLRHGERKKIENNRKKNYVLDDTTYVEGHITENTTWDIEGNPYVITYDVFVDSGCTLTIEPGVDVLFDVYFEEEYHYLNSIIVYGRLFAIGTEEDSVTFTYLDTSWCPTCTQWGSVWFADTTDSISRFEYCRLVFGHYCIVIGDVTLSVQNCYIKNNILDPSGKCGIYCTNNSKLEIVNSHFIENSRAIQSYGNSYIYARENFFDTDTRLNLQETSVYIVSNNFFGSGIVLIDETGDQDIVIERNVFTGGRTSPMIYVTFCASLVKIYNNTIVNNEWDAIVVLYEESSAEIINNNIGYCERNAIYCGSYNIASLKYNCFYGNTNDFYFELSPDSLGYGVISNVNTNGDSCDSFYNIFLNPLLVDSTDFNLLEDSPCIDAGDSTFTYDIDGTIADIGAFPFNQTPYVPETGTKTPDRFEISCYPNPYSTAVTVEFRSFPEGKLHLSENIQVEIFDINGRLVNSWTGGLVGLGEGPGSPVSRITGFPAYSWSPTPAIPSGIYFIKVSTKNWTASQKLIYLK